MTAKLPQPPKHLSKNGRALWRAVVAEFDLEAHQLVVLTAAAEARDRAVQAREIIDREGMVVDGRYGARQHPLLAVERDARTALARLLRELRLDVDGRRQHVAGAAPGSLPAWLLTDTERATVQ